MAKVTDTKKGSSSDTGWYGRLDREVILDASLRLTARPDVTQVRFRDLGVELGADPTAVYRHFRNKQSLMTALIERLLEDVAAALPTELHPAAYLTQGAEVLFETFNRHPAIGLHLADDRPIGPSELELAERIIRSLEIIGLRDQALIEHYATYSGFLLAYVANACRVRVTAGGSEIDDVPWVPEDVEVTAESHPAMPGRSGRWTLSRPTDHRFASSSALSFAREEATAETPPLQ
jgi:AcrR family transcriptional regulator